MAGPSDASTHADDANVSPRGIHNAAAEPVPAARPKIMWICNANVAKLRNRPVHFDEPGSEYQGRARGVIATALLRDGIASMTSEAHSKIETGNHSPRFRTPPIKERLIFVNQAPYRPSCRAELWIK